MPASPRVVALRLRPRRHPRSRPAARASSRARAAGSAACASSHSVRSRSLLGGVDAAGAQLRALTLGGCMSRLVQRELPALDLAFDAPCAVIEAGGVAGVAGDRRLRLLATYPLQLGAFGG